MCTNIDLLKLCAPPIMKAIQVPFEQIAAPLLERLEDCEALSADI